MIYLDISRNFTKYKKHMDAFWKYGNLKFWKILESLCTEPFEVLKFETVNIGELSNLNLEY